MKKRKSIECATTDGFTVIEIGMSKLHVQEIINSAAALGRFHARARLRYKAERGDRDAAHDCDSDRMTQGAADVDRRRLGRPPV